MSTSSGERPVDDSPDVGPRRDDVDYLVLKNGKPLIALTSRPKENDRR